MKAKTFTSQAERIMVALDVDEINQARTIAQDLSSLGVTFKIGNQLGTYEGWETAIEFAKEFDAHIFCDTKFKDIPATVEKSARAITRHQPDFFNVMADNTPAALEGAMRGITSAMEEFGLKKRPTCLGVTVLTSISDDECVTLYGDHSEKKVLQFARQAAQAGLDGVVCSAQEATLLSSDNSTNHLLLVTPGIRPSWAVNGDQTRITTPRQALENGADYLVIGRPITKPPTNVGSPREATLRIIEEIS